MADQTFIIDCQNCKKKIQAKQKGVTERSWWEKIKIEYKEHDDYQYEDYPFAERLYLGQCTNCETLLVGKSRQVEFICEGWDEDSWSDIVRVYPDPPKTFLSTRIPQLVKASLHEAEVTLQCDANVATCVMLGRTLEAICRDVIKRHSNHTGVTQSETSQTKPITLHQGINKLKEMKIIDERLFEWSQHLKAFRNLAAHAVDIKITRRDAEDLKIFVYAIIEYVYDLTDRYNDFIERLPNRNT